MDDLDGLGLSAAHQDKVNRLAYACLGSQQGQDFLAYLKNVTINRPRAAGVDPDTLMHCEGQRWIVGLIQKRTQLGEGHKDVLDHERIDEPRPARTRGRGKRRKQ
jgi:hypothetical protein